MEHMDELETTCGYLLPRLGEPCGRKPGHGGKHMSAATRERYLASTRDTMRARRGLGHRTPRTQQYGLSPAKFERLLEVQGGSCAVCSALFDALPTYLVCIDHDHAHCDGAESCGECVRGIVCHGCNTRIARYEAGHLVNWTPGMLSAIRRYLAAPPAQHLSRRTVQVHDRPGSGAGTSAESTAGTPETAPGSAPEPASASPGGADIERLTTEVARLRERNAELAAQLREYATGARRGVVLEEGKRYVYQDGELKPWVRTTQARAE